MAHNLDMAQVIKKVYDPDEEALKTTATVALPIGAQEVIIDSENDSIQIGNDVGDYAKVNTDGSLEARVTNALVTVPFDAITYTATSGTVDTYAYKTGGTGGTTVATVTVTWTDSSHTTLVSVVKT